MKITVQLVGAIAAVAIFSGCAAPCRITSNPSGATISLDGRYIGETPMSTSVKHKHFDGVSTYTFTATKQGYRADSKVCQDASVLDWVRDTIPPHIHFDLQPVEDQK